MINPIVLTPGLSELRPEDEERVDEEKAQYIKCKELQSSK